MARQATVNRQNDIACVAAFGESAKGAVLSWPLAISRIANKIIRTMAELVRGNKKNGLQNFRFADRFTETRLGVYQIHFSRSLANIA
ncbi:MAG: hypothetical protein KDA72_22150, partial [Planctomycetales bacterium]|nr:hypothetical protein [Planctomycetales bacterium]